MHVFQIYNSLQLNRSRMQFELQDLLSQIRIYKGKVTITQHQLQNYIKYLDQAVFKTIFFFCSPNKVSLTPSFERAFSTLIDIEKADYYLSTLKIIYDLNSTEIFVQEKKYEDEKFEVLIRKENQRKLWKKTGIFLHYDTLVLQVEALNEKLNLMNYIIRKSKSKHKNAIVLESTRTECEPITLRIAHTNDSQMQSLLAKMRLAMRMGLRKKIARMMQLMPRNNELKHDYFQRKEYLSMKLPSTISLQKRTNKEIMRSKTSQMSTVQKEIGQSTPNFIANQDIISQLDNFEGYEQIQAGYFIHKTKPRVRKMQYYNAITISLSDFDCIMFNHQTFKLWKSSLYAISLIGDVPKQSTKFYHQVDVYKDGKEVDYVFKRHRFERQGMIYFVDRSEVTAEYGSQENIKERCKIEYGMWRVRHKSKEVIQLITEFQITHLPSTDVYKAMSEHIGQLEKIPAVRGKTKASSKNNQDNDFFSVNDNNLSLSVDALNELQSYEGANIQGRNFNLQRINHSQSFYSIRNSEIAPEEVYTIKGTLADDGKQKQAVKSVRYQIKPQMHEDKLLKQFKNGCFFDAEECVVTDKGDLMFTNQQKITAQGSVIKNVLKKIGANIFTGKNILNISLPIQIFATDTNLQRLCRSMAYAPHFLENKAKLQPLEKMKAAICFALGNLLLYIEMAKPFNPILGETYQGFIDGCPIYGEQISHHPPISSLLLLGRGYRVSANIQAKVDLGLNSASGLNDGNYHITFGNQSSQKSGIFFTSPPGELSGVVYGDRKLNIINKSRYLDVQNRLFCELSWGKNKGGNTVCRFHDYVEGKIVQLFHKPTTNIQKIKQSEKDRVLGHITGRWTEFLYFNGEPIFQVNKLQPYRVIQEERRLLSDSYFREDRLMLQKQKYKEAQSEKERLEQLQRRDRKLRKQKGV